RPARPARRVAPPASAKPPPAVAARPQAAPPPRKKRRSKFRKLKRSVGKFFKRSRRKIERTLERDREADRRDAFARREAARRRALDERRFRDRRYRQDDAPRRFEDRRIRRRSYDDRRLVTPPVRRDRYERRDRERALWRQQRRESRRTWRRDRRRAINGRRHVIRDRRYRNRFRRGRSIYYLPPAGIALAAGLYALDSSRASHDDYVGTFMAPPVRALPRRYSLDDIMTDPEVRAAVRSVNIDVLTFASGSARIPAGQLGRLEDLADAIHATLRRRPDEVFLIAGHTDAVGSFETNLDLSKSRAAAVQQALVDEFNVPPENLESVGYGEQYLRIDTDGPDRRNRRVVVRAIGALLARR
ncbi:MAG: OmpA family protein, partial [Hyphomicrobiaceae bacterium]